MRAILTVIRILRSRDCQQFSRIAPFRVQGSFQLCTYRDRRDVVEWTQHNDAPVSQANRQNVISIVYKHRNLRFIVLLCVIRYSHRCDSVIILSYKSWTLLTERFDIVYEICKLINSKYNMHYAICATLFLWTQQRTNDFRSLSIIIFRTSNLIT